MLYYLKEHTATAPLVEAGRTVIENGSRRAFLKGSAAGAGLVVALRVVPAGAFETYPTGAADMPDGVVNDPNVFVYIEPDGSVVIVAHRSEMGTGVRTTLPMVVADEMEADWGRVRITQAPGDEPTYGNQDTDGSRSMRHFIQPMRECGAAERWGVDPEMCRARNHEVVLMEDQKWSEGMVRVETDQRLGFGDLAEAARGLPVPPRDALRFKSPSEWRYISKGEVSLTDLHDITTGKAQYGADVRVDGMKIAVIARPPVVGGKVKSYDDSAARAVPDVHAVIALEGRPAPAKFYPLGGIAVIADNTFAATKARDLLENGTTVPTPPTTPPHIRRRCAAPRRSPARSSAIRATSISPSPTPPAPSAPSTSSRTWPTSPWSRRRWWRA
jgi:isoquinoline 1-oxidoreductase beta subunit